MATPTTTPNVNKPLDPKMRDADVNRKLQVYGIIYAFKNGKLPSNDQIDIALNSFLQSRALSSPSGRLSEEGRQLVADVREVVKQSKYLLLSKNQGNLLQDFIWQTQQFDTKSVSGPDVPVDKDTARQHGDKVLEGLRTLGTLIITNGQFRKLLSDATILFRDMAGDAATHVADRARPSDEQLAQIDQPADDHTWHDAPDFSKDSLKKKAQAFRGKTSQAGSGEAADSAPAGYVPPEQRAGQPGLDTQREPAADVQDIKANASETTQQKKEEYRARLKTYFSKKMPQDRRDQTVWRLKKMIVECQQHPDYQQAISALLDLADEYGSHANRMARDGSGSFKETRSGLAQAEADLRTLIERFANGTSTHDLWDSINTIYKDSDNDPELKDWFKSMNSYIRRCLKEQGYIMDEQSNEDWRRLYDHGHYLLREKYRGHSNRVVDEIKFLGDQFEQDPLNKAYGDAMTRLFMHLGNDENGKPTFKPHLVKDLTNVIIPAILENTRYIPLPRMEYSDPKIDAVIDNLVLESDNFMPNVLEIANENYLRWGRKSIANKNKHSVEVNIAGVQMDLRHVSYYIRRKEGFPTLSDTGMFNLFLGGQGFTSRLKLSSADEKDAQNFLKVDKVDIDMKNLKIKLLQSKHKFLFNLFSPIMLKAFRPAIKKAAEKAIREKVTELDRIMFQIKQEADRTKDEFRENPEQAPNIYNRYASAIQKRLLEGKQKAEKAQAAVADKKLNYAIAKDESIFPDIKLPGEHSSKATEYRELARKGDRWESPVFSIGDASRSTDIPSPPKITRKPHSVSSPTNTGPSRGQGYGGGEGYGSGQGYDGGRGYDGGQGYDGSAGGLYRETDAYPATNAAGVPVDPGYGGTAATAPFNTATASSAGATQASTAPRTGAADPFTAATAPVTGTTSNSAANGVPINRAGGGPIPPTGASGFANNAY